MEWWNAVLPVVTLIAGFFLNVLVEHFKARRDLVRANREAIGRALCTLLDIHSEAFADGKTGVDSFMEGIELPPQEKEALRSKAAKMVPESTGAVERYNEAVATVAGTDPILAFDLLGAEHVPTFLEAMYQFAQEHPSIREKLLTEREQHRKLFRVDYEKLILRVASLHGPSVKRDTELELRGKRD